MNQAPTSDYQGELLTQVDQNNQVLGSIERGVAHHTPGVFYRTVYILIKNDQGQILLQKRSATKDLYPDCWDLSVGGHVGFGQSYLEAAVREVSEEVGIEAKAADLKLIGEVLVKLPNSGEFFQVFEYSLRSGQKIKAATAEISHTKWMTLAEIKESINNKTLKWYPRPVQVVAKLYRD